MVMGFIEVMNLSPKLADTTPIIGPRKFKTTRSGAAIHVEEIPKRADSRKKEEDHYPRPFAFADGVDDHPEVEKADQNDHGKADPRFHAEHDVGAAFGIHRESLARA